ncbi:MAG TPA: sigma-70 family RNA polymerase sigma factor [Actinomycetes bacterium]|nr:sigma-70 family RNA polymerase sigma factor [Actinomycetes bacterium]
MTPDGRTVEADLVRAHLPLAHQAVNELARRLPGHVHRDDLLSAAAMLGLAQAARSWDPGRGASFEHHAATRIRGALLDELRGADWASRSVRSKARRMLRARDDLTLRLGRTPTTAEVAAELGTDAAVHKLTGDLHRATVLNLESIVAEGDADELLPSGDHGPDQVLVDRERRAYLVDAVLALPERLRAVVVGDFYQERPMLEIAAELGVTESRVSQLRGEALILLRDGLNAHLDPDAVPPSPRLEGRVAKRRAAYHAAIGACSDFLARLDAAPRPLLERVAASA